MIGEPEWDWFLSHGVKRCVRIVGPFIFLLFVCVRHVLLHIELVVRIVYGMEKRLAQTEMFRNINFNIIW